MPYMQALQKLVAMLPVADAVQVVQEGLAGVQERGALHRGNPAVLDTAQLCSAHLMSSWAPETCALARCSLSFAQVKPCRLRTLHGCFRALRPERWARPLLWMRRACCRGVPTPGKHHQCSAANHDAL